MKSQDFLYEILKVHEIVKKKKALKRFLFLFININLKYEIIILYLIKDCKI